MKTTGYILNGVYYEGGKAPEYLQDSHAVTSKSYDHDRQRENHRRDILQPYTREGKPNPEFIEQYPDIAESNGLIK